MPMTKAEKQRAYRERKKKNEGGAYIEKERKRIRGYYVPIEERSKKEQEKRRNKVRRHVKQHRQKKKRSQEADVIQHVDATHSNSQEQIPDNKFKYRSTTGCTTTDCKTSLSRPEEAHQKKD